MSAFEYTALDPDGRERRGLLEGDTARQVRQQLRDQGLSPLSVDEASTREQRAGARSTGPRRGIGPGDLALVTRQLATLVQSGMPVEEGLRAIARYSEKTRLQRLVLAVRARVVEGHSLAAAFAEYPRTFPEIYVATVRAGEQSGHLGGVLERLADYTEQRQDTRSSVTAALAYPIILTLAALAIVVALLTYVVPKVVGVFDNLDADLPLLTQGLLALSGFLQAWGPLLLGAAIAAVVAFRLALRHAGFRARVHATLLRVPMLGPLLRDADTARFARTLSILAASGVPVLEALAIASTVIANRPLRAAVERAAGQVREGGSLSRALQQSGHFPPMFLHLIAIGEESGQLDAMLHRAADYQERATRTTINLLVNIFEPALILVMGGVVLLIVLAILLPIFELNQLVG
jgi:general secretion pathway protein F